MLQLVAYGKAIGGRRFTQVIADKKQVGRRFTLRERIGSNPPIRVILVESVLCFCKSATGWSLSDIFVFAFQRSDRYSL